MDEETRLEEALEDVAKIHPRIREVYEVGASHAWYDDRFATGAFALFEPEPADAAPGGHRRARRAGSTSPASTARCTTRGSRAPSSPASAPPARSTRRRSPPPRRNLGRDDGLPTRSFFQHGVASGDPTPRRVVIWTRVSAPEGRAPTTAFWRVLELDTGRPIANGQTRIRTEADSTVRIDVGGLRPDTRYRYEFEVDGEPSPQGRTRTLPEHDAPRSGSGRFRAPSTTPGISTPMPGSRSATTSRSCCTSATGSTRPRRPRRRARRASRDIGRPFDPLHECKTLEDYRARYAQYRRDPDVQAVSAAHPVISTVDDHEFADGAWRDGATEHSPSGTGPGPSARRRVPGARGMAARATAGAGRAGAGLPGHPARVAGGPVPARHADAARRAGPAAGVVQEGPDLARRGTEGLAVRSASLLHRALAADRQPVGHGPDVERQPARTPSGRRW